MLIHTDQKPYQCDQCDQSFRQKQLLKRHQNLYHNPEYVPPAPREKTHECSECSRAFRHKGNLIRHMASHDPDPDIAKKQLELKLGRQKKIQMIDGQQVEVLPSGIGSEEEEEIDMMAVEGSDGQQYVVLEVIQLADGEDQNMVVGDGSSELLSENMLQDGGGFRFLIDLLMEKIIYLLFCLDLNDEDVLKALQSARRVQKTEPPEEDEKKPTPIADRENFFGFDVSLRDVFFYKYLNNGNDYF